MRRGIPVILAFIAGSILTAAALCVIAAVAFPSLLSAVSNPSRQEVVRTLSAPPPAAGRAMADANMVAVAAAKISPAVVDVHTQGRAMRGGPNPFFNDPFFRRFFGAPDGEDGGDSGEREGGRGERMIPTGAGSGVIISEDGYIITNQHVIADAARVTVKVGDKGYDARVIGSDWTSDIAVVKIDPRGAKLHAAEFGNSDNVKVGDWALAVGNPLDIGTTVTLGIISAVNRRGLTADGHPLNSVIQTDAAVNPGNSGGALANIQGQLVGINEAIASPTGAYVGIGFAIPVNAARKIAADLIENGKVVRPYLGVSYRPLKEIPPDARRQLNITLDGDDGVVVAQVFPGSPAAKAGLQLYDVILEANRQKITDSDSLNAIVNKMKVGETLALLVSRNGQNQVVTATLQERPASFGVPRGQPAP